MGKLKDFKDKAEKYGKAHPYFIGFLAGWKVWMFLGILIEPLCVWLFRGIKDKIGLWIVPLSIAGIVPYIYYISRHYYKKLR